VNRFVAIGERIALYRRRRGLSQVKLAGLVGRSESWLSQVERGARPIERLGILGQLATVLDVPLSELTGTPPQTVRKASEQHQAADEIRVALTDFDFLALLLEPEMAQHPGSVDLYNLEQGVRRAWEFTHASAYDEVSRLLHSLLAEGEVAARRAEGQRRAEAFTLLARTYQAVAAMTSKLGETELAWVAADRSIMAAERGNDPLLAFAGMHRLSQAFLTAWRLDQAERVASAGALAVASQLHDDGTPGGVSLYGALNLVRAIGASRRGDGTTAWQAIGEAERAAARLGVDRNDFETEFGPTNVALHGVAVAVELGEAAEALRRAAGVHADHLSVERRARFLIDVARAHGHRRDTAGVVSALSEALAIDPDQVRYHPLVRELVSHCLRRNRRRPDATLSRLAEAIGLI
jgi:transcriptional regulator with XRE-family HTH domain